MPGAERSQITMGYRGFDCFHHFFRTTRTVLNPSNAGFNVCPPKGRARSPEPNILSNTSESLKILHIATYILHFY